MKKSFILHCDTAEIVNALTDAEAGQLLKAFYIYNSTGETPALDRALQLVFLGFKNQFVRDAEKYEQICQRNRENGQRGGRPKKQTEEEKPNGLKENPQKPNGLFGNPTKPKKADSDSDNDSDSGHSKESVCNTHVRACETPTLSQVKDVCKAYGFDEQLGEKFYLHYQANGWVQGTGVAIRDWVAQLNKWVADQNKFEKPTATNGKPAKYKEREYSDSEFEALFEDLKTVEL